jgi:FixJ family two-component response regulator
MIDEHCVEKADTLPVVFVVDNDEAVLRALGNLLRSTGLRVETFAAAPDFLAVELPRAPCCLILEVRLPGLSGLDFQAKLASA